MLTHFGFKAWIAFADGFPLPEYGIQVDEENHQVSCYVSSEAGKRFSVRWRNLSHLTDTIGDVFIDGCAVGTLGIALHRMLAVTAIKSDVVTSSTTGRPFVFTKINEEDDESDNEESEVGEIRIVMSTAKMGERAPYQGPDVDDSAGGASKKHCVKFDKAEACRQPPMRVAVRQDKIATFVFKYRPREVLLKKNFFSTLRNPDLSSLDESIIVIANPALITPPRPSAALGLLPLPPTPSSSTSTGEQSPQTDNAVTVGMKAYNQGLASTAKKQNILGTPLKLKKGGMAKALRTLGLADDLTLSSGAGPTSIAAALQNAFNATEARPSTAGPAVGSSSASPSTLMKAAAFPGNNDEVSSDIPQTPTTSILSLIRPSIYLPSPPASMASIDSPAQQPPVTPTKSVTSAIPPITPTTHTEPLTPTKPLTPTRSPTAPTNLLTPTESPTAPAKPLTPTKPPTKSHTVPTPETPSRKPPSQSRTPMVLLTSTSLNSSSSASNSPDTPKKADSEEEVNESSDDSGDDYVPTQPKKPRGCGRRKRVIVDFNGNKLNIGKPNSRGRPRGSGKKVRFSSVEPSGGSSQTDSEGKEKGAMVKCVLKSPVLVPSQTGGMGDAVKRLAALWIPSVRVENEVSGQASEVAEAGGVDEGEKLMVEGPVENEDVPMESAPAEDELVVSTENSEAQVEDSERPVYQSLEKSDVPVPTKQMPNPTEEHSKPAGKKRKRKVESESEDDSDSDEQSSDEDSKSGSDDNSESDSDAGGFDQKLLLALLSQVKKMSSKKSKKKRRRREEEEEEEKPMARGRGRRRGRQSEVRVVRTLITMLIFLLP
ncbi:hypothetical protein BDQ17DRAFT_1346963 [Cyathus striatus]|nr:hypothetical protein BDQ17DRAFT_1346963 [Cyathus striatus]